MAILSAYDLGISFIDKKLFEGLSFTVESRDKIGFIGANGSGKTTLFKILTGSLDPDSGSVTVGKDVTLGYMEQHACKDERRTVYEELLSVFAPLMELEHRLEKMPEKIENADGDVSKLIEEQEAMLSEFQSRGGLTYKSRTKSALAGLGFSEEDIFTQVGTLSGGQRSKLSLAKLLLSGANFLLLDEPTNHLDINSVGWLENYLKDFDGSAIIISHDRYFLDAVTNKTMELYCKHLVFYKGNYSAFIEKKKREQESIRNKYENDLKEIKRIEGIIAQQISWSRERNFITAASKQKEIDRIKAQLVPPEDENNSLSFRFELKSETGNDVVECKELSKSFGKNLLFRDLSFKLVKGERVFIMGGNGTGKTTLFRMLMGRLMPDSGYIDYGTGVKIGYFDQMQSNLDLDKNPFDEIHDEFPLMTETQVRSSLARFRLRGDDVFRKISEMSGGERAKINLLRLMLRGDNFLLLDEPTNHLDTFSRESLEKTLSEYKGTLLVISHDRYFINKLADRILYLTENGFTEYLGNYDYFLERTADAPAEQTGLSITGKSRKTEKPVNEYKLRKEEQARERKRRSDISKLEKLIEELDAQIAHLNELISGDEISSDYEKLMECTEKLNDLQTRQEEAYEQWSLLDEL